MTPEALLAILALVWLAALAGLWRIAGRLEQMDRLLASSRQGPAVTGGSQRTGAGRR